MEQSALCGSMSCWGSLLGISLSTGTITSMVSKCAQKVGGTLETIKSMLIGSKVANFDETGTDVNGKTIWVHNSSTSGSDLSDDQYHNVARSAWRGMVCSPSLEVLLYMTAGLHTGSMTISHTQFAMDICCELTGVEQYSPGHCGRRGSRPSSVP